MKNNRCYGKKAAAPKKEKSFITKFFEGNESSDASLFGKSSEVILQKDSYEDNKENVAANITTSPSLFENVSVKCLTPEKEIFCGRQQTKTTHLFKKGIKQKKQKRNVKKKTRKLFHYSTKYYKLKQPRWSEIYKHDLTIERQETKKTYSLLASRYQNRQKRIPSKKMSKDMSKKNFLRKAEKMQKTNQQEFSLSSDTSDSSDDLFKQSNNRKSNKMSLSHFRNTDSLKQKCNNDSSIVISELSKKFNQSMKLDQISVAPDHTLHINEELFTKSPLNNKSPISCAEWKELKISGGEKLSSSQNSLPLLTKCNGLSAKEKSFRHKKTSKKFSTSSIYVHNTSRTSVPLERTSALKFMTSTPIMQKFRTNLQSPNIGSICSGVKNSSQLNISSSKANWVISYFDKHNEKLNCYGEENENSQIGLSWSKLKKSRISLQKDLLLDLYCSNKSMTLPGKHSVKSLHSLKSRSSINLSSSKELNPQESAEFTKIKLLKLCNQDSVTAFADAYDWKKSKIKKIGEGSYGEVFMLTRGKSCVLKIIPISEEGTSDCYQGLANVLSEVKISKCLSELRNNKRNQTNNFIKLNSVTLVSGIYPSVLLDAWDDYSNTKSSYNERPDNYGENQMFVLLELEYGGKDMSCCVLRNAAEAESVLKQVATTLAVAEEEYVFEHRDLHLGNILIQRNRRKSMSYKLRGKDISFECHGVQAILIDFTLSRLHEDGYIYYNDLANDVSLFEQSGDYQFDVYKCMKKAIGNEWQKCCLYSNVLWLKFLCRKFKEFEYSRPSTQIHKKGLEAVDIFSEQLTNCNCALDSLTKCGITSLHFERSKDFERTKKSILVSRNSAQKSKLSICH